MLIKLPSIRLHFVVSFVNRMFFSTLIRVSPPLSSSSFVSFYVQQSLINSATSEYKLTDNFNFYDHFLLV